MKCISILLLILVMGCTPGITSGKVISTHHEPFHLELQPQVVRNADNTLPTEAGKTLPTGSTYSVKMKMDPAPESWTVTIEGTNENGETVRQTSNISEEFYSSIKIGQYITLP